MHTKILYNIDWLNDQLDPSGKLVRVRSKKITGMPCLARPRFMKLPKGRNIPRA
jgi:hypothetical protein